MARNPIDASARVSAQLSEFMESWIEDPDVDQPISLVQVRRFLVDVLPGTFHTTERMHRFDVDDSVLDELDALIEEYGEEALAVDFVQSCASEPLSRVIEAVVNDENRENPPTLAAVREAMTGGLLTRLVGDGVLEEDEDDSLLTEMDGLIERYGDDALAEEFLRYE